MARRLWAGALCLVTLLSARPSARAGQVQSLPNGLRYVILEDHVSPVVSLQIWVRCGGVNENDVTSGVSHFLEHMLFKGTAKLTAGAIAKVVESRGGSINAATGAETTHYYIDVPSDAFDEAFSVLADSVLNPSFPPTEFEKERLVILEEIKRRNDNPQSDVWDGLLEVVYKASAYRRNVIGSEKTIRAMPREVLMQQHQNYYVPQNMVVVIAGDVKAAVAKKKVSELFGGLKARPLPPFPNLAEPGKVMPEIKDISRQAQQAHVAFGFVGPSLSDPMQVAMDALSTLLGGGNSSRLYQSLREEKQLVWSVGSSFITHYGSGLFGIFAECPPEKARALASEVYFLLMDASNNGFDPRELARAKAQMRSSWLFSQETYHGQASTWGFYTALNQPKLATDYLKILDRVTMANVKDLLDTYFQGRELSGVVLRPSGSGAAGSEDDAARRAPGPLPH